MNSPTNKTRNDILSNKTIGLSIPFSKRKVRQTDFCSDYTLYNPHIIQISTNKHKNRCRQYPQFRLLLLATISISRSNCDSATAREAT